MNQKKVSCFFSFFLFISCFGWFGAQAQSAQFLGPVVVSGKGFAYKNFPAKRFMIRGVALASANDGYDILEDAKDSNGFLIIKDGVTQPNPEIVAILPKLISLNINAIRVYQVDPFRSHTATMQLLEKNGIYVEVGAVNSQFSVHNRAPEYTLDLYSHVAQVVEAFADFPNVLGYSIGNEVIFPDNIRSNLVNVDKACVGKTDAQCTDLANGIIKKDAAVLKSLARDIKKFIADQKYRQIPIGLAMQDTPTPNAVGLFGTPDAAKYYVCGDSKERLDYIGLNAYRYITPIGNEQPAWNAYDVMLQQYGVANFPVPFILSESGAMRKNGDQVVVARDWAIISKEYNLDGDYPQYIQNMSGEFAFMFYNWKEQMGLYESKDNLVPSQFGGAAALAAQYLKASQANPALPTSDLNEISCDPRFNPPLLPMPSGTPDLSIYIDNLPTNSISVRFSNFSDKEVAIVQDGKTLKNIPAATTGATPSSVTVDNIDPASKTYILLPSNSSSWSLVCTVKPDILKTNAVVSNNVSWGGDCNVSLP